MADSFTSAGAFISHNDSSDSDEGTQMPFRSRNASWRNRHPIDFKDEVHERWKRRFRTSDNQQRFSTFLDHFFKEIEDRKPGGSRVLDAGCGSGEKSIELGLRNFSCVAVDVSDWALGRASKTIERYGLENQVTLCRGELSGLSFADNEFDYVLCWGVLMHIRELSRPMDELARLLAPGGFLIVNEINMHSFESRVLRQCAKLSSNTVSIRNATYGVEVERKIGQSGMFIRHTNLKALISGFERRGLTPDLQLIDQFTEFYKHFGQGWFRGKIQGLNA
ncbi:MAG: class I SAM-dependent methyltransferase, partial [bacterium]